MKCVVILCCVLASSITWSQEASKTTVGGFVDAYFAYGFNDMATRDRSFTTQPLRHDEFNLNLAMIDIQHQGDGFRGRFALQTGTYVQSNLAAEPQLLKSVLEASVGARLGEHVWVDMGIFPSHIGWEGIVSKDNWTYSRSMVSDFSPFYEAGIALTVNAGEKLTLKGCFMNGWQNISETNDSKAVGTQVSYKPSDAVLLNWSTFAGNEQPDTSVSRLRLFNDLYVVLTLTDTWSLGLVFDVGFQKQPGGSSYDVWDGGALMVKCAFNDHWTIAGRAEYYQDKNGVIVPTGTPGNFQTVSGSVNVDFAPSPRFLWRAEFRIFRSKDGIYPTLSGMKKNDGFAVISAAVTL
jgi:hypothetical protein